jgi:hypothetical protein
LHHSDKIPGIKTLKEERCIFAYSFRGFVGSGDLRQMSEYPIPHGEHYHSCILKRWRPAFLHPKGEIQSLIDLPQG